MLPVSFPYLNVWFCPVGLFKKGLKSLFLMETAGQCGVQFCSKHSLENSPNKSPVAGGLQGISDTLSVITVF